MARDDLRGLEEEEEGSFVEDGLREVDEEEAGRLATEDLEVEDEAVRESEAYAKESDDGDEEVEASMNLEDRTGRPGRAAKEDAEEGVRLSVELLGGSTKTGNKAVLVC
jgi:hypothetical protein